MNTLWLVSRSDFRFYVYNLTEYLPFTRRMTKDIQSLIETRLESMSDGY
jgi:hypothetical protein